MIYDIKIKMAGNGYIAETPMWDEEDKIHYNHEVFEEEEGDELGAARSLLYFVLEQIGMSGSKHEPRLRIVVEMPDGTIKED